MSRYEHLSEAFRAAGRREDAYEAEARAFAERLFSAFVKYLEAPPRCVTAHEPAAEILRATAKHLRLAVKQQDEVLFGFTIALWFEGPFDSVSWPVEFAKTDAGWRVALRGGTRAHIIGTDEGFGGLLGDWGAAMDEYLASVGDPAKTRSAPIGFRRA